MKILFVIPSYKPAYIYGGPVVTTAILAERLVRHGHQVTVYTTTANGGTELDVKAGEEIWVDGVWVTYFKRITKDHTHISIDLWKYLNKTCRDFDVVHVHSWWNFLIIASVWICRQNGVKPILSPHGMFSDFILNKRNRIIKKLFHNFIGKGLLRATFLHVSTEMEWDESKKMNPVWEGRVIPNLVKLSDADHSTT